VVAEVDEANVWESLDKSVENGEATVAGIENADHGSMCHDRRTNAINRRATLFRSLRRCPA
jgi:hypothetical protein